MTATDGPLEPYLDVVDQAVEEIAAQTGTPLRLLQRRAAAEGPRVTDKGADDQ